MKALFGDQLTALLAAVIFPGVGQEAFMFAIIIIAVPLESVPFLPTVIHGDSVKTDCKDN